MRTFVDALETIPLGGAGRKISRKQLIARLDNELGGLRVYALLWGSMVAMTFVITCAALIRQIVQPYVALPLGVGTCFLLMSRVERVWRERERFRVALFVALNLDDEEELRKYMLVLRASLLSGSTGGSVREGVRRVLLSGDTGVTNRREPVTEGHPDSTPP